MTNCTDEDLIKNRSGEVITFSAIKSKDVATRGTPITTANDISNMCVYGYYTGNGSDYTWDNVESTATSSISCEFQRCW